VLGESSFSNIACGGDILRKNLAGALESTRTGDMLSGFQAQARQVLRSERLMQDDNVQ